MRSVYWRQGVHCLWVLLRMEQVILVGGIVLVAVRRTVACLLVHRVGVRVFGVNYQDSTHVLDMGDIGTVVEHKAVEIRELEDLMFEGEPQFASELMIEIIQSEGMIVQNNCV